MDEEFADSRVVKTIRHLQKYSSILEEDDINGSQDEIDIKHSSTTPITASVLPSKSKKTIKKVSSEHSEDDTGRAETAESIGQNMKYHKKKQGSLQEEKKLKKTKTIGSEGHLEPSNTSKNTGRETVPLKKNSTPFVKFSKNSNSTTPHAPASTRKRNSAKGSIYGNGIKKKSSKYNVYSDHPTHSTANMPVYPPFKKTQLNFQFEALKEKSLDIIKQSTPIIEMFKTQNVNSGVIMKSLFADKFFKSVLLSMPVSLFENTKKLERFLEKRIKNKIEEMLTAYLLEQAMKNFKFKSQERIDHLRKKQNSIHNILN